MTTADKYRVLAAEMDSRAGEELSPELKAQWRYLARGYRRLAEQADRNSETDVVYGPWPLNDLPDRGEPNAM